MLPLWIRRLVVAAALVVMPLHGLAATLSVLLCHGDAQVHASHVASGHADDDHGGTHSHGTGDNDGSGTSSLSFHLCCNLTASAPPAAIVASYLPDFPVQVFYPGQLHDSFVPELPQRPPLV